MKADLDAHKAAWLDRVDPEIAEIVEAQNASLRSLAELALGVGDLFPAITLPDHGGRPVDLGSLASASPLIVTVYRGGWCPYCNLELRAYQKSLAEIEALGARLVGVSPEAPDNTLTVAEKNALAFPVLSDTGGRLAGALGIRFELSPPLVALYRGTFGLDLPTINGDTDWWLPLPATYVVAEGGRIAYAFVDPDYRERADPAEVIAVLEDVSAERAA